MRGSNLVNVWASGAWTINALNSFFRGDVGTGLIELGVGVLFGYLGVRS